MTWISASSLLANYSVRDMIGPYERAGWRPIIADFPDKKPRQHTRTYGDARFTKPLLYR